ncbi:MAG: flagellar export chaperone FliS [Phycisphaerales bacterium]
MTLPNNNSDSLAGGNQKAKTASAYLRTRVMTASPEELRLMLLEAAVRFARQGREGMTTKNYELTFTGMSSARDIVVELLTTIRDDVAPELAANVKALYAFMYKELVDASINKDVAKLDKVIELLEYEVETWRLLMIKLADERRAAQGDVPTEAPKQPVTPSTDAITAASSKLKRSQLALEG